MLVYSWLLEQAVTPSPIQALEFIEGSASQALGFIQRPCSQGSVQSRWGSGEKQMGTCGLRAGGGRQRMEQAEEGWEEVLWTRPVS